MGKIEVQGIVAVADGLPYVQFRKLDDKGNFESGWQMSPVEAREHAQNVIAASMNAVYDAALLSWARSVAPNDPDMGPRMVKLIREYRADVWGLPDSPEDWRK